MPIRFISRTPRQQKRVISSYLAYKVNLLWCILIFSNSMRFGLFASKLLQSPDVFHLNNSKKRKYKVAISASQASRCGDSTWAPAEALW